MQTSFGEWLDVGTTPQEIAVLVRQQPHLAAASLGDELTARSIAYRNEQESQDLTAEPVAALILSFLQVIADDRQPDAYTELMRIATRSSASEDEAAHFDSRLKRILHTAGNCA